MSTVAAKLPQSVTVPTLMKSWGLWAAFVALLVVVLLPPAEGLPVAGQYMLGILPFAVILWMTEAVDYAISAVIIAALMAFLLGMAGA